MNRKQLLASVNRIVVKVGSGVLTRPNGLNLNVIDDLTAEICLLNQRGIEVILISSGAIAAGLRKIGLTRRPQVLAQLQALAAMGQSALIRTYEDAFARHGQKAAQVLLTRDDLTHRGRYLNARNTLFALLAWNIVPVINENDTVAVDEIRFGDNDTLGALVTNLTGAGLLVNLTNLDGLYDQDPRKHPEAKLLDVVDRIDARVRRMAGTIPGLLGTGGMKSKIAAAEKVSLGGSPTIIANGLHPGILQEIFAGKPVGTLFLPQTDRLSRKEYWIAFTKNPRGEIGIDAGAEKALTENGKSLLASGIRHVSGRFGKGDAVVLKNPDGREIAVGMVNYDAADVGRIKGAKSGDIETILGYKGEDEVIHRDNLVFSFRFEPTATDAPPEPG